MRDESAQWLHLSQTDLRTALQLHDDGIYYAAVFFAQHESLPPKTHNLVALSTALGAPENLIQAAAELGPEYIVTRYITPDVASPDELYDEASSTTHLDAARSIADWLQAELEEER